MFHDRIEVEQDFLVAQFPAIVASRQRDTVAGKAREKIGNDRNIAGVDEFLTEVRSVLDDAVALMQMDHDRFLAGAIGDAEKAVHSIVDFDSGQHENSLLAE